MENGNDASAARNFKSELTSIPGVGDKLKERLLRNFGSLKRVGEASIEELRPFVGQKQAERILEHFRQQREPEESNRTEQHPPAKPE